MFDISFSEILVIAVVAVVVIGPERLPKTVRTLGHLMGRAQRYVGEIKADIQREMELEELHKVRQSMQDIGKDIEQSVQSVVQETGKAVKRAEDNINEIGVELDATAASKPAPQISTDPEAPPPAAAEAGATAPAAPVASAVPASLQGEVELSIPETPPAPDRKPGER